MKIRIPYLNFILVSCLFLSCKKYDSFTEDFDFSAVYFASQKPVRTVVAYDTMQFKIGITLAGKRENTIRETTGFEIDPSLLSNPDIVGGNNFQLLPSAYYSLSKTNSIDIEPGSFLGDITVTLNRELFTSDPLAHLNTYAIPIRLTTTTADSILRGRVEGGVQTVAARDYSVIVVKYISPLHGTYYRKGVETKVDENNVPVSEIVYSLPDLIKNTAWGLTTTSLNEVVMPVAGTRTNASLLLTRGTDNSVQVESVSNATVTASAGSYDPASRSFYLDYGFTQGAGANLNRYVVKDTLVLRQAPELDLRFEEW